MSVKRVDNGGQALGALSTVNISLNSVVGLANITLPTTKPTTPSFSFTIDSTMLPTSTANINYKISPFYVAFGQNNSGAAATVTYDVHRNGTSISTGTSSSIANLSYYTISAFKNNYSFTFVQGDLIEVFIYANVTGVSFTAWGAMMLTDNLDIPNAYDKPLVNLTYNIQNIAFLFNWDSLGITTNPSTAWNGGYIVPTSLNSNATISPPLGNYVLPYYGVASMNTIKFGSTQTLATIGINTHTNYYPFVQVGKYPASISYREVL